MLDAAGRFLFRWRNLLFPIVFAALLALAPPRGFGERWWDVVAMLGVLAIIAGQTLRVVTIGLDYIKRGGKNGRIHADRLVTGGVYAHCRNPMYVGNVLVAVGALCMIGRPWTMIVGGAFFVFAYVAIVRSEERYLSAGFGEEYREYCERSPRWRPHVRGLIATLRAYRFDWPAVIVKEYGTLYTTLMLVTGVLAWKAWHAGAGAHDVVSPWFIAAAGAWTGLWLFARWLKKGRQMKSRGTMRVEPDLNDIRRRIDEIDAGILELLNRRATHVASVFELKQERNIRRYDPQRTEHILARLERLNRGPLSSNDVRTLYSHILRHFVTEFRPAAPRDVDTRPSTLIEVITRDEALADAIA